MTSEPLLSNYFSEHQTAAELCICLRTLRRWRDLGQGPAMTRLGRRVLYRRNSVMTWLASREQDGRSLPMPAGRRGSLQEPAMPALAAPASRRW